MENSMSKDIWGICEVHILYKQKQITLQKQIE